MAGRLMEFILKNTSEEEMHFIIYGDFLAGVADREGLNIPEFKDIMIKKVTDGKENDWESPVVTFSGHKMSNIDCAEQVLASMISNESDLEVIYLASDIEMLIKQYTEKTAFESDGRQISEYYYSPIYGTSRLYFATDKFLYYDDHGATTMISTRYGHVVADGGFAEEGLFNSFRAVEEGTEKLLYGKVDKDCLM